jgi:murein DD-endopeptidase MepM/ murein hydrolase activator NlpD
MSLLFDFLLTLFVTSACLFLVLRGLSLIVPKLDHWPGFWAMGLVLTLLIPLLGAVVPQIPGAADHMPTAPLPLHGPIEALSLPELSGRPVASRGWGLSLDVVVPWGLALYLFGVGVSLLRLSLGRRYIRQIVTAARRHNKRGGNPIYISSETVFAFAWSPLLKLGAARKAPLIIMPQVYMDGLSASQIDDIIRHEAAHLSRRDDECGFLLRLILCFTWISPFAHGLMGRWSQSTELQCDQAVTAGRMSQMRRDYAETLLQALHIMAGRVRQYPAAAFSTHRLRNEKMRINHIMKGSTGSFKRPRHKIMLALSTVGLTLIGTASVAMNSPAPSGSSPSSPNAQSAERAAPAPKATAKPKATPVRLSNIVAGRLTARFGQTFDPFKNGKTRMHHGVDIAADTGTPIYAPAAGTIQVATDLYDGKPAYGKVVVLRTDDGLLTLFSHLESYAVTAGQIVAKGEQIAAVGNTGRSTGPHVHIEAYRNGERLDPLSVWPVSAP